jgi:metal-responsive CopG/Arc/MetJ family transcriptional regulator
MKTAISIPDEIFSQAEELAKTMHISRSKLFTLAISEFIEEYDNQGITSKLNKVYQEQESSLDPGLKDYQKLPLPMMRIGKAR